MEHVHIPKIAEITKKKSYHTITVEEYQRLIKRFPPGSSFYIPLQIGFHTGMRAGEVTALRWCDIDFNTSEINVIHTLIELKGGRFKLEPPKTKSSLRTIRIGPSLIKILKQHKLYQKECKLLYGKYYSDSEWLCTKENGDHITTGSLRYLNRVANYEMGIAFSFHYLRHTHATMMLEGGVQMKHIQNRLGHSKLATTMDTYSHITDRMVTEAVEIFEQKLKLPTS